MDPTNDATKNLSAEELRTRLEIRNTTDEEQTVVVEPWANEFPLPPGETCAVIATHSTVQPWFFLEANGQRLTVWVEAPCGGGNFEFWHEGKCIV
jgi:hypothetical protein